MNTLVTENFVLNTLVTVESLMAVLVVDSPIVGSVLLCVVLEVLCLFIVVLSDLGVVLVDLSKAFVLDPGCKRYKHNVR